MPPTLRLNPDLDPADFADAYARDGFVQIPAVLPAGWFRDDPPAVAAI